jgi:general secretion pathway protein C
MRVATVMRTNGWVLNLVFIAIGAYFVAGAFNAVLARSIRVVPNVDDAAALQRGQPTSFAAHHDGFGQIAERNLMALRREVLNPQAAAEAEQSTLAVGRNYDPANLKQCTITASLRATLVADGAPEWSMAVLVVNNENSVFNINEGSNHIADDAYLVDVLPRAIVVRRRDHFERCSAEGEGSQPSAATASASPAPMATVANAGLVDPPPGDMTGVTRLSDTNYNIERGELDKTLGNLNEVATQARIVPSFKNGKANGFKMFSIKPGSIYSKIGLQNGDVIQKINGYEINSPDKALEIYGKLKDATNVTIELQRRGTNMTFNYAIGG